MSALSFEDVKKAVLEAGFEVFRAKDQTIQLAERVRSHLMDANVTVRIEPASGRITVAFVVRGQRSDFPNDASDDLFVRVRKAVAPKANEHGFTESAASSRSINDPSDDTRTLDTWHELTFSKTTADLAALVADVQCALGMPKCISG